VHNAPAYGEQRGIAARRQAEQSFAHLSRLALANASLDAPRQLVEEALHNFRAAPLSPAEQARRAGQLLRYLALVPVEYGRGVADGRVTKTLEIQEAVTFLRPMTQSLMTISAYFVQSFYRNNKEHSKERT
jgi:high-affinity iron transporter